MMVLLWISVLVPKPILSFYGNWNMVTTVPVFPTFIFSLNLAYDHGLSQIINCLSASIPTVVSDSILMWRWWRSTHNPNYPIILNRLIRMQMEKLVKTKSVHTLFNSYCASVAQERREKVRRCSATRTVVTKRRKTLTIQSKYSTNKGP